MTFGRMRYTKRKKGSHFTSNFNHGIENALQNIRDVAKKGENETEFLISCVQKHKCIRGVGSLPF